jgi:hypothetical protein
MELIGNVGHVKSCFGAFRDSANLDARELYGLHRTYHRLENRFRCTRWCTGSANVPQAKKLFWMQPMELLDDEAQVEARFGPFEDIANLDTRYVQGLCGTYHQSRNNFRCTQRYSYSMRLKWKLILVRLKIVLILTQDRCTVCTEHTIGSEIVSHTPDETPRWRGSCGVSFRSIWRQC